MKCPYCGELLDLVCDENGRPDITHQFCPNTSCNFFGESVPNKIWQDLIDGKKARQQLRTVKDRCVKKVKAKEREIVNYLNGIYVRQSENERLEKELQQTQDALKEATKCINWTIDTFEKGLEHETDIVGCCELSLERIDEITQQDTKE